MVSSPQCEEPSRFLCARVNAPSLTRPLHIHLRSFFLWYVKAGKAFTTLHDGVTVGKEVNSEKQV